MLEWKKLGDVCEIKGRIGFRGYTRDDQVIKGEGAISLSPGNISDGVLCYDTCTYITWSKYEESPEIMVQDGDIILCKTASVGKVARVKHLPEKATINPQLVLIKNIVINPQFLYYVLADNPFQSRIKGLAGVGSVPNVSQAKLASISIPVPSISEQTRIVGILDTFTASIENLKQQIAQRRKQYEHYRDQMLDLEGKEGVEMKTLGEVGDICMCKRIMKEQTSEQGDIPFFKIGTFGGEADAYISRGLFEDYKRKFSYPKKGDVLISAAGTIGRSVIFDGEDAYFQDSNIVWINNNESIITNKYLYYLYQVIDWKTDGGTIKRLYNYNLKSTIVPIPSLTDQQRIVSILDTFDASIANLEQQLAQRERQYEYYRNKLLTFE